MDIYVENVVKDGEQPTQSVLFLHGMKFSSKNWLDIKSVHHVAQWGYRAVAVDLPGSNSNTCIAAVFPIVKIISSHSPLLTRYQS